ncbi:hypothetical protein SAV14893_092750 [Streptomyces avermitilis]|uniref:Uncharacterized protein n=1 Tax=Streptomyces avermitilis TaxID=33903 RepID=A0A4D4MD60_STRAX|nr:hypothetical protein SAVMC3_03690 [Streptomyces avermitilis]GDY69882.1 hypothetical protein SAV14893_092750 [Streptomyces avermitilis]GDY80151.1 hypothetical protein SAV31267_096360 [Streptomyces avermitilis]
MITTVGGSVAVPVPQPEFTEVAEDHPAGRPCTPVVGIQPGHGLVMAQRAPDLALDQAEHQQGHADHLDECGDAAVVLDEDRGDGERAFEVAVEPPTCMGVAGRGRVGRS